MLELPEIKDPTTPSSTNPSQSGIQVEQRFITSSNFLGESLINWEYPEGVIFFVLIVGNNTIFGILV